MPWGDIVIGYGLQRVPQELVKEFTCCLPPCVGGEFPTRVLWTDKTVVPDGTMEGYRIMVDALRDNCYCKMHALRYFGER